MVNERFINIPPHVAVPLHKTLRDEVEDYNAKNSTSKFDYLLLILKSLESATNVMGEEKEPKKKKKKDIKSLEFINFEDRLFHEAADVAFSFNVSDTTGLASTGRWDHKDKPMKSMRTVVLVDANKWHAVVDKLEQEMEGELTYEDGME